MWPKRKTNYSKLAANERVRQRQIAYQYLQNGPSVQNLYNAATAFWKSLPFVGTTAADMNPYTFAGEPTILPGRVSIKGIKIPKITKANATKVTAQEWDAAYNAAIKSENLQEAQRLRDLHFYAKSSKSKASELLYKHSTYEEPFNSFDLNHKPNYQTSRRNGKGVYLEDEGSLSRMSEIRKRIARGSYGGYGTNTMNLRVNFKNPEYVKGNPDLPYSTNPEGYVSKYESFVKDPRLIKSDNAVTYDDARNIIPLSERDNFSINDVRYFLPFAIGGGIGYGLYNDR